MHEDNEYIYRREYRGQCEQEHVFKGELFGPSTPDAFAMICPVLTVKFNDGGELPE